MKQKGKVYLVDAGPGEIDLLTVRGADLLARAEVVVYDALVNPALLELAPPAAEIIFVGADGAAPKNTPELNQLIADRSKGGKNIVWLKQPGGQQPSGVHVEELTKAGLPTEIIPGVGPAPLSYSAEDRPFSGQTMVVTRARGQASSLSRQLTARGARVLEIPTIKIVPPDDKEPLAEAMVGLGEYDWLVFTSPNGVNAFFDYFLKGYQDLRAIGNVRIAAVGPGTAARIQELHLRVDVMPQEHLASHVAQAMHRYESVENLKILLLRAEVANPELPQALSGLGAIVDDVACYKTAPETEDRTGAARQLLEHGADWILFTSGSTVENFHARFNLGRLLEQFPKLKLASIGPETTKAIAALGLQPSVEARQHHLEGLVSGLEKYLRSNPPAQEPAA